MRTEAAFPGFPLTVLVGPMRYVFAPGRDVVVGYGPGCDIRLERLGNAGPPPPPVPRTDMVLRFTGRQWVAVDSGRAGIFFNGMRVPNVEIRDGQAISIGDPQRGPRLVFHIGAPPGPPGWPSGPPQRPPYPPPPPRVPRPPQPPRFPPPPPPHIPHAAPPPYAPHPAPPPYAQHPAPPPHVAHPPPAPPAAHPAPAPPVAQPAPAPPVAAQPGPPERPAADHLRAPTERDTQHIRVAPPRPSERPTEPAPSEAIAAAPIPPPAAPIPPPPPAAPPDPPPPPPADVPPPQPAAAEAAQSAGRGLIERMATRKIPVPRPSPPTEDGSSTYRLPLRPDARTTGVAAHQLGLVVDGHDMLADISFTARPGTLTAVTGPSAARNSALLALLAGTRELSAGRVTVDGHDVHAEPEPMRSRIGTVTRDECIHARLTVEQVVAYAAELHLPPDTSSEHRGRVVDQVLEELDLTEYRATRVAKLPPEVRRCASMAVELITRPTLLVVDEPGAGLDAAQENHVMAILRRQADLGCVVVVAVSSQESLSNLDMCDQVMVLTAMGTVAFLGPPLQIESAMGTSDWAEVLAWVSADPEAAHRAYRSGHQDPALTAPPEVTEPWPAPPQLSMKRQIGVLTRRQIRLLFVDRIYFLFWAVLPFVLGALAVLIPGDSGLDRPESSSDNPHEAVEILAALNIAAVLVGTALTIRVVVAERRVFRREQALGLSATAYLAAKVLVFSVASAILTAIVFSVVMVVKGGPVHGAVLLGNATFELYVAVALTAIVSAVVGLALSTAGKSLREVLPLMLPVILASLLFDGSLIPLVSKWGFQQISWFVPAQWGFAASASTVDLRRVDPLAANAEMWTHYSGWWVFDVIMLLLFGGLAAGLALYRLRPPPRGNAERSLHREQQELGDLAG